MKRLEIFKPGTHTAMSGKTVSFGESDLRAAVLAYDPAIHEAPLVLGHPKDNHPAFGWVNALSYNEETGAVEADPYQLDADFEEAVQAGRYKKLSASWYTPDSPANPKPGAYYLRHVGFLGAIPPAIKGLRGVSFSEADEGVLEFGWIEQEQDSSLVSMFRGLRDFFVAKFGVEDADKAVPSASIENLQSLATRNAVNEALEDAAKYATSPEPSYQEALIQPAVASAAALSPEVVPVTTAPKPNTDATAVVAPPVVDPPTVPDPKLAEFAERETVLQTREAELKSREDALRKAECADFAEGLVKDGKVLPVQKDALVSLLMVQPTTSISFGEGDKKAEQPAGEALRAILSGLPKVVAFGESNITAKLPDGASTVEFAAPDGMTATEGSLEIVAKAEALQKKDSSLNFQEALQAVLTSKE